MKLKQTALTIMMLMALSAVVKAQYMPESSAFKVGFARSPMTNSFIGGYTYFLTQKVYISGSGNFEWGSLHQFDYTSLSGNLLANYSLANIRGVVFFNVGAGAAVAYDTLKPASVKGFDYGAIGRVEVETFITDAVSFIMSGNQTIMSKKEFGQYRSSFGLGIRLFM